MMKSLDGSRPGAQEASSPALHRRAWLMFLLCGIFLFSSVSCTRLRVEQTGYPPTLPDGVVRAMASPPPSAGSAAVPADAAGTPGPSAPGLPVMQVAAPFADAVGVTFVAYQSSGDGRRHQPYGDGVLTQLWLERAGQRELVHRSDDPAWSRVDLIPGHYVLEVIEIYQADKTKAPNDDNQIEFDVQAGSTAQVAMVLKQVPWGEIVIVTLAVVFVVLLVVLIIAAIEDLPKMRGSGRGSSGGGRGSGSSGHVRIPPPPRVAMGGPRLHFVGPRIWVPLDLIVADIDPVVLWTPDLYSSYPPDRPRLSRIALPSPANPDGEIRLEFAQAMEPFYFDHQSFRVMYGDGTPVAGGIYYDTSSQAAYFHPLRPLEPGRYKVTVYGELLYTADGVPLGTNVEQTFQIGGEETLGVPEEEVEEGFSPVPGVPVPGVPVTPGVPAPGVPVTPGIEAGGSPSQAP